MTKHTIIPKLVKVSHIYYGRQVWNGREMTVKDSTITVGTYYVAEQSKTPDLNEGDAFIIKEHYLD